MKRIRITSYNVCYTKLLRSLITISSFSQVIGGSAYEKAFDLIYGDDECLYLTGFTSSYGNGSRDGFIVKYNCVNGLYSYNTWGRTDYDEFRSIVKTNDGFLLSGFVITSYSIHYTKLYDSLSGHYGHL